MRGSIRLRIRYDSHDTHSEISGAPNADGGNAPHAPRRLRRVTYRSIVPDRFFSSLHGFLSRSITRLSVKSQALFG